MAIEKVPRDASTSPADYRQVLEGLCTELGEFFGSALGNGMSKLVEDPHGNFVVANDGTTLVRELHLRYKHPVLAWLLGAGDVQGRRCGDLVKSTLALSCRLVLGGLDLARQGVHPNAVREGYASALRSVIAQGRTVNRLEPLDPVAVEGRLAGFLVQRLSPAAARHLAHLVSGSLARHIARIDPSLASKERAIDSFLDELGIVLDPGGNIADSFVVQGAGIVKDPLYWQTDWNRSKIQRIEHVKIAMVSGELYFDKKKRGERISFPLREGNPSTFKEGLDAIWMKKATVLSSMGVRVLVTEKGIDDALLSALNALDPPILVFKRAKTDEMRRVARHVGAAISYDIDTITDAELGQVTAIEAIKARDERCFVFRNERDPDHQTIVIRGSIYDVCDAAKHHLLGAIGQCFDGQIRGIMRGFPWIIDEIVNASRKHDLDAISPHAMMARETFMQAVNWLPRAFAANQGIDPLDARWLELPGVVVTARSVESMLETAAATAIQLLRVDAMIAKPGNAPPGRQKREETGDGAVPG